MTIEKMKLVVSAAAMVLVTSFPVTTAEAERIHSILDATAEEVAGTKKFLVFETLNGWTLAMNLDLADAVRIMWDPIEAGPEYEPASSLTMHCHLQGREDVLSLSPLHADETAALLLDLDAGIDMTPKRFLSITDEDDEKLYLKVAGVALTED